MPPKKGGHGKGAPRDGEEKTSQGRGRGGRGPGRGGVGRGIGEEAPIRHDVAIGRTESSQPQPPVASAEEVFPSLQRETQPSQQRGGKGKKGGKGKPAEVGQPSSTSLEPTITSAPTPVAPSETRQPQIQPSAVQEVESGIGKLKIGESSQVGVKSQAPPSKQPVIPILHTVPSGASLVDHQAIARPSPGRLGRPVNIRANHFLVKASLAQLNIYHYDVAVSPSMTNKGVLRAIVREIVTNHQSDLGGKPPKRVLPAYDGAKNIYSVIQLPFNEKDFRIVLPEKDGEGPSQATSERPARKPREFRVVIKLAQRYSGAELDLYLKGRQTHIPQELFQAFDICLQQRPMRIHHPSGRSFFDPKFGQAELGSGLIAWRGFYQSLRPTQQGLSLNLDVSCTAFYCDTEVIDYVSTLLGRKLDQRTRLNDSDRVKVKKALNNLKVQVTHRPTKRTFRINGVTREGTDALHFPLQDGDETGVLQYFKNTYKMSLKFPLLPCLTVGKGNYLPMEVCCIVKGQKYVGKLSDTQITNMLRATCKKPHERQNDIYNMVTSNSYSSDEYAKQFGLDVSTEMAQIRGRVLDPPNLTYASNAIVKPSGGAWNLMGGHRFVEGKTIQHWALINFGRVPPPVISDFVFSLSKRCNEVGVPMNNTTVVPPLNGRFDNLEDSLRKLCQSASKVIPKGQWLQLLVVILPEKTMYYNDLKRLCDTQLNVPTQCCLQKHVFKNQSQYLANLAMKINVKVGGRNVLLQDEAISRLPYISDRPTMVIGADVSHPPPGESQSPSIAAVVGSMDWPQVNRYSCILSSQVHRQEIIDDLHKESKGPKGEIVPSGIVRKLLFNFYRSSGRKPDRMIIFRDGVSEGQFYQVLAYELTAIKRACMLMDSSGAYSPTITFIIVQKRHHTRLFPTDRNTDRSGNVMPGTCVDTVICHPREFDFYLNSHSGIQGTSRPTHYHVLFDENKFTSDGIQNLCNSLCYTYARCTRSVSVVPPVYYADLAATRATLYLQTGGSVSGSESGSFKASGSSGSMAPIPFRVTPLPEVMDVPMRGMFFC